MKKTIQQIKWFAFIPHGRWVRTEKGFEKIGIYWFRKILLTRTFWNGWTAFADDNDLYES